MKEGLVNLETTQFDVFPMHSYERPQSLFHSLKEAYESDLLHSL